MHMIVLPRYITAADTFVLGRGCYLLRLIFLYFLFDHDVLAAVTDVTVS